MLDTDQAADISAAAAHNSLALRIAKEIVSGPTLNGGTASDVLALLETIVVGVVGECAPPGKAVYLLEAVAMRAGDRLSLLDTAGTA